MDLKRQTGDLLSDDHHGAAERAEAEIRAWTRRGV